MRRGLPLALLWLVSTALGCRQILGIDDRDPLVGGGGSGGSAPVGKCAPSIFAAGVNPACLSCITTGVTSCCAQIDACSADPACRACLTPNGYCASPPGSYIALSECVHGACSSECYPETPVVLDIVDANFDLVKSSDDCVPSTPSIACNPMVQSYACNWQAGQSCDMTPHDGIGQALGFSCFVSNRRHIGQSCGIIEGSCHFGLTCVNTTGTPAYRCGRLCCHDGDCGPNGACDTSWVDWRFKTQQGIGVCVVKP